MDNANVLRDLEYLFAASFRIEDEGRRTLIWLARQTGNLTEGVSVTCRKHENELAYHYIDEAALGLSHLNMHAFFTHRGAGARTGLQQCWAEAERALVSIRFSPQNPSDDPKAIIIDEAKIAEIQAIDLNEVLEAGPHMDFMNGFGRTQGWSEYCR